MANPTAPEPEKSNLSVADLAKMGTEARNPASHELDTLSTLEIVTLMNNEDANAVAAVQRILPQIAQVVDAISTRMMRGGRLIYTGAGTSGRLGVLDAAECPPTFDTPPEMVVGIIAGGQGAMFQAVEAAEDNAAQGGADLAALNLTADDSVVGLTASGRTPYVVGALDYARQVGALAIGLSCNSPSELEKHADIMLAAATGAEVLSGSTRLKAGTAQKLVLNMLSTATMVRLGKTYGNLMVDMRPTNHKLRRRAVRIVMEATGVDEPTATTALESASNETKTAIVALLANVSPEVARARLAAANGFVRMALQ